MALKRKQNGPTETDELSPIPMAELIIHRIAPIPGALILRRSPSLKTEPGPFRSFHIASTHSRFIVEGEIDPTLFLVRGQVKFRDNASNDFLI